MRWLSTLAMAAASVACQPAADLEPVAAPQASESAGAEIEPAAQQPSPEPRVDGLDLIMTPEQRYARQYGSCDFIDPKRPAPPALAKVTPTALVMDVREGGKVVAFDQRAEMSHVVARLKKLANRLRRCGPLESVADSELNTGRSIAITLTPVTCFATPEMAPKNAADEEISQCLVSVLRSDFEGLDISYELNMAFAGFRLEGGAIEPPPPPPDKESIRRTINRNMHELSECYEPAVQIWPDLRGTVSVRFAISTLDGAVLDADVVQDETENRALACCIARKVYGWKFEAAGQKGITVVTYPFLLETVEQ